MDGMLCAMGERRPGWAKRWPAVPGSAQPDLAALAVWLCWVLCPRLVCCLPRSPWPGLSLLFRAEHWVKKVLSRGFNIL